MAGALALRSHGEAKAGLLVLDGWGTALRSPGEAKARLLVLDGRSASSQEPPERPRPGSWCWMAGAVPQGWRPQHACCWGKRHRARTHLQKPPPCGHFTVVPALPLHGGVDRRGTGLIEPCHRAQGSSPEGRTTKATPGAASWEKGAVGPAGDTAVPEGRQTSGDSGVLGMRDPQARSHLQAEHLSPWAQ